MPSSCQAAITEGRDEKLDILQYRKDSTPFRAMLFASPVNNGYGTVTNYFLSYRDITRRYETEKGLRALTAKLEERVAARTGELKAANTRLSALVAEGEILLGRSTAGPGTASPSLPPSSASRGGSRTRPSGPFSGRPRIVLTQ